MVKDHKTTRSIDLAIEIRTLKILPNLWEIFEHIINDHVPSSTVTEA